MAVRLAIDPSHLASDSRLSDLDTDALLFAELLEEFGILRGDDADLAALAEWMRPRLGLTGIKALEAIVASFMQISPTHYARDPRPTAALPSPDALLGGAGNEVWHVPVGGFGTSQVRLRWREVLRAAEVLSYPADGEFGEILATVFQPLAAACREIVYLDRYLGHELADLSPTRVRPRLAHVALFLFDLIDAAEDGCELQLMTSFHKCTDRAQLVEVTDRVVTAIDAAAKGRALKPATIRIYATRHKLVVPHDRRFRFGRTVLNLASGHEVLPGGSDRTTMAGVLPWRAWRETCREEETFRISDSVYAPPPIVLG